MKGYDIRSNEMRESPFRVSEVSICRSGCFDTRHVV